MWNGVEPNWALRYELRNYFRDSIWILPMVGMAAALVTVRVLDPIERLLGWEMNVDTSVGITVLSTISSSMFTFMVFVSSALLVAVQLASAQLTPRIIAFIFRDPVMKWSLTAFVYTFTFSMGVLVRVKSSVPLLAGTIAAYSSIGCMCIFLYMVHHVGRSLRASGALRAIGLIGRRVIEKVYPPASDLGRLSSPPDYLAASAPVQTVLSDRDGVILAFDARGLVAIAKRFDCLIEVVPQVGDFVAVGDPLFRVFKGGAALPAHLLNHSIAIGRERTFEQDPGFALRITVDIACKALSPAINDPTTAVLALDEIHHLLRAVGSRHLDDSVILDTRGSCRLAYHVPDWQDFVSLSVTEIRQYGAESIQVARRLRAMLENLIQTLPESRSPPLRTELAILQRSAKRFFAEPEDLALAEVSDPQGVGGRHTEKKAAPLDGRLSHKQDDEVTTP